MPHYAITKTDGSVAIMQTFGNATADECIAKWHPDEQAKVQSCKSINPAKIPQDRTFRDAWALAGNAIVHDMTKARSIKRDQLRALRAPILAELDTAYQRADETKDEAAKTKIAADKQKLRDATANPDIDDAATVDDLRAIELPAVTVPTVRKAK